MATLAEQFGEPISVYTREQAIDDGVLIDGTIGDLAEVSRQHFKYPIAMTAEVFEIIERAVNNPKYGNDYKGVWHDILYMSIHSPTEDLGLSGHLFQVIIKGAGRKQCHTLKILCHPDDNAEPVLTVMLPNQD